LNDERVEIKHTDGRLFLNTTPDKYDLILVGIMEPSNLQTNRFFTKEFFSLAKKRLNEVGILVIGLPGSLDYLNEELRDLNSSIFHTLKSVFANTRVIPGDGTNLFLASDSGEISTIGTMQVVERLDQRNIQAEVIVPWHIESKLHQGWQDWLDRFIEGSSEKINSDFNPVGLFYSIAHWNALYAPSLRGLFRQFERINLQIIILLFAVVLLFYFFLRWKSKRVFGAAIPYSIVTTGFAGMIFDLVSILTFQSIYGYVFSWIGLLVAIFMAGAASGAMFITTALARIRDPLGVFKKMELALIGFSIGWPIMFLAFYAWLESPMASFPFRMLLLAFSFIGGLLIGCQFPLANKIYVGKRASVSETAGLLYASDLLGGWFGGIIGAVVLLPVLGLVGTCITVGLLKLTSFIVITTQPDHGL
jgi:spermidine synthase